VVERWSFEKEREVWINSREEGACGGEEGEGERRGQEMGELGYFEGL
jgi:hypothetical protein